MMHTMYKNKFETNVYVKKLYSYCCPEEKSQPESIFGHFQIWPTSTGDSTPVSFSRAVKQTYEIVNIGN